MPTFLTLKEFWDKTQNLPYNTIILLDEGDLQMHEASIGMVLPKEPGQPTVITLEMGQVWNSELDIDARIDKKQAEG